MSWRGAGPGWRGRRGRCWCGRYALDAFDGEGWRAGRLLALPVARAVMLVRGVRVDGHPGSVDVSELRELVPDPGVEAVSGRRRSGRSARPRASRGGGSPHS